MQHVTSGHAEWTCRVDMPSGHAKWNLLSHPCAAQGSPISYTAVHLVSMLLKDVIALALQGPNRLNLCSSDVMLAFTFPSNFPQTRRGALVEAATLAGIPQDSIVAMMDEATAAVIGSMSIMNLFNELASGDDAPHMIVCDVGGGTTDASVISVQCIGAGVWMLEMVECDGIVDLAGKDLKAHLRALLLAGGKTPPEETLERLMAQLSVEGSVTCDGFEVPLPVFEKACERDVARIESLVIEVAKTAAAREGGARVRFVALILCGGPSQMPQIVRMGARCVAALRAAHASPDCRLVETGDARLTVVATGAALVALSKGDLTDAEVASGQSFLLKSGASESISIGVTPFLLLMPDRDAVEAFATSHKAHATADRCAALLKERMKNPSFVAKKYLEKARLSKELSVNITMMAIMPARHACYPSVDISDVDLETDPYATMFVNRQDVVFGGTVASMTLYEGNSNNINHGKKIGTAVILADKEMVEVFADKQTGIIPEGKIGFVLSCSIERAVLQLSAHVMSPESARMNNCKEVVRTITSFVTLANRTGAKDQAEIRESLQKNLSRQMRLCLGLSKSDLPVIGCCDETDKLNIMMISKGLTLIDASDGSSRIADANTSVGVASGRPLAPAPAPELGAARKRRLEEEDEEEDEGEDEGEDEE